MDYRDRDKNLLRLLQRNNCFAFGYINNPNRELPPTYLVYDYEDGMFETAFWDRRDSRAGQVWGFNISSLTELQRMMQMIEDCQVNPLTLVQHAHQLPLDRTHRYFYSVDQLVEQVEELGACADGVNRARKASSVADLENHLHDTDWNWLAVRGFVQAFEVVQRRIGAGTASMHSLLSIYMRHPEMFKITNVARLSPVAQKVMIAAMLAFTDIPLPRSFVKEHLASTVIDFVYTVRPWRAYWC